VREPAPPYRNEGPHALWHVSEEPSLGRFEPHVAATAAEQEPLVWAVDTRHLPLYWFPRDCPRVTAWPRDEHERAAFDAAVTTTSHRVHAIEAAWLDRVRRADLYRYDLPGREFVPWAQATGQWVADHAVEPLGVEAVGDLLAAHAAAGIELRIVPSLWPLHDLAVSDRWDFSIVRMGNAQRR
jgi:hypothetical protein